MTFESAVQHMIAAIKARMGIAVTYAGQPIVALDLRFGENTTGAVHADTAEIEVAAADVPAPQYRDAVVIAGITWRVHRDEARGLAITGDGHTWRIPLIKDERIKR